MNKWICHILIVLILVSCSTSCRDCYYIENELHGIWQVASVEKKSTGEVTEPGGRLYYMFQRTMAKLCYNHLEIPEYTTNYIAHIDFIGTDSIGMGDFRFSTTGEGDYVNKENRIPLQDLHKFGLYEDYTIFHIEQSKSKLIFTSDSARIVLRKY